MTLKELSAEYDRLYEEADELFKEYNPCQFENGKCSRNRADIKSGHFRPEGPCVSNGCCTTTMCEHLTPKGCSIKALGCKLHVCLYIHKAGEFKKFYTKMRKVRKRAQNTLGCDITQCFWEKERFMTYSEAKLQVSNG